MAGLGTQNKELILKPQLDEGRQDFWRMNRSPPLTQSVRLYGMPPLFWLSEVLDNKWGGSWASGVPKVTLSRNTIR